MKKTLFVLALLAGFSSFGQWPWEKIQGNGNLKKESRTAGSFSSIASAGPWEVKLLFKETNSIEVEADENLLPYIETRVENGKLSIRSKKEASLRSRNKITVYVGMNRLRAASLSGSGNISGDGKFETEGKTEFNLSGSGNINLAVKKASDITVSISGSGNIHLSGNTDKLSARISGSGNAECTELSAEELTASISGSGNVRGNASKAVMAHIAGSGSVFYKGTASEIQQHVAGSGRVSRL